VTPTPGRRRDFGRSRRPTRAVTTPPSAARHFCVPSPSASERERVDLVRGAGPDAQFAGPRCRSRGPVCTAPRRRASATSSVIARLAPPLCCRSRHQSACSSAASRPARRSAVDVRPVIVACSEPPGCWLVAARIVAGHGALTSRLTTVASWTPSSASVTLAASTAFIASSTVSTRRRPPRGSRPLGDAVVGARAQPSISVSTSGRACVSSAATSASATTANQNQPRRRVRLSDGRSTRADSSDRRSRKSSRRSRRLPPSRLQVARRSLRPTRSVDRVRFVDRVAGRLATPFGGRSPAW